MASLICFNVNGFVDRFFVHEMDSLFGNGFTHWTEWLLGEFSFGWRCWFWNWNGKTLHALLVAKTWTYEDDFPMEEDGLKFKCKTKICLHQFPIVLNHATTGHKLQGKSLDQLVVVEWSKTKNWAYVVLSRVRSLDGLFLMEPIPEKIDFKPSDDYN